MSTLNICDGAKQIYPKKQKKILRGDSTNFCSNHPNVKKMSLF